MSPEKAEEAKLKARYPHLGTKPGGSDLLRKRLQKGVHVCAVQKLFLYWTYDVLIMSNTRKLTTYDHLRFFFCVCV